MKRGVATITIYVYGETEKHLVDQSKHIAESINTEISRECEASVEKIHSKPFGAYGDQIKEIKFDK